MSHEVETMMVVGEAAWHGLGVQLEKPPTIAEGIEAAGLDWEVNLVPAFIEQDGKRVAIPGRATVRSTDGAVLGVVGTSYRPLQNAKAFEFFQPFLDSGAATLESAGSLKNGTVVWVLAKVAAEAVEISEGDRVEQYILLSNSHDGSRAVSVGFTAVRVVCNNTLTYAHSARDSKLLKVRHTKNAEEALDRIREVMDVARSEFIASTVQMRGLVEVGVDEPTLRKYVREVFQTRVEAPKSRPRVAAPRLRVTTSGDDPEVEVLATAEAEAEATEAEAKPYGMARVIEDQIVENFHQGRGAELPGSKGTLWGAYNAVTEYVTHQRGKSQDSRLEAQWFGEGAKLSRRALDVAQQFATAA